ncbi:hypothetical protein C7974DRAFT_221016 [Boeremia exigua]|uniref:uncharacterized protein n=1 Tax=Boeremia exigua TaxID=749465 RepID=UPI001E8E9BC9|nr:uncharacterized protein C7974DRAFT_221016 [Boeremia exigua]KAH6622375.1 hypothetical protein C7974DRAFT_221016 [Boeremia exigua]
MAPSTRLRAQPARRVDYGPVVPAVRPGSFHTPIILGDTPPPEEQLAPHPTAATKLARNAQGRFVSFNASPKPKPDRKKVTKSTSPPKKECLICATSKGTRRCFKTSALEGACEHFEAICNLCVQKQVKTKMSGRQLTDAHLPCMFPGCAAVLDHAMLKEVMTKALFETWDMAVTKHFLAADPSYVACLNSECGVYFSVEGCAGKEKTANSKSKVKPVANPEAKKKKKGDGSKDKTSTNNESKPEAKKKKYNRKKNSDEMVACPHCDHDLCLSCNRPGHTGSCDSAKQREDEESVKAIKTMGAKPCPQCGINITKNGGCDHMTCQNCRHNFCWECGGGYKGLPTDHATTCSHATPLIAHDIGNFVDENLTVAQVNVLIARARADRDAGLPPRANLQLAPGVQLVNGAAVRPGAGAGAVAGSV